MTKLIQVLLLSVIGLAVLDAASGPLTKLAGALVTPILVGGLIAGLLRCVWWMTGPR